MGIPIVKSQVSAGFCDTRGPGIDVCSAISCAGAVFFIICFVKSECLLSVRGVFNLVGPGAVPISTAIRESGGSALPVPETLTRILLRNLFRWGLFPFPADAVDFIKYPCTIDGRRFREATGFVAKRSLGETLRSVRP